MWHTFLAATPTIRWLPVVLLFLPARGANDTEPALQRLVAPAAGSLSTAGLAAEQAACERRRGARPKSARVPSGPEEQPGWLVDRMELDEAVVQKLRSLGYTQ